MSFFSAYSCFNSTLVQLKVAERGFCKGVILFQFYLSSIKSNKAFCNIAPVISVSILP